MKRRFALCSASQAMAADTSFMAELCGFIVISTNTKGIITKITKTEQKIANKIFDDKESLSFNPKHRIVN